MPMKLNLITLGLMAAAGQVAAADFGVMHANTSKVNTTDYQCQRCVNPTGLRGEVSVSTCLLYTSPSPRD